MEQQARTAANSAGKALGAAKEMAVGTMASSEIAEKMNDFANKKVTAKDEVSKAQAAEVKNESKSNDSQNQGDFNTAHENSKYSDQSEDSVNETFDDSKDDFKKS
jgi:hypothetical protein